MPRPDHPHTQDSALPPTGTAQRPPGPLLPTVSIVEQTMLQARRSVAAALIGMAAVGVGLAAERLWYSSDHQAAARHHAQARQVAGELRLVLQQLEHAAQMAVATGQPRWMQLYDSHLPGLDEALMQARAMAPEAVALRFETQTRLAGQELLGLHETALEALTVGAHAEARAVFDGDRHRQHMATLRRSAEELSETIVGSTQDRIDQVNLRAIAVGASVAAGCLLIGLLLWRHLTCSLQRSRRHFLEAEERIQRLASRDLLTGLSNRAALHDSMQRAMQRARRKGQALAVLMIDLDRFKPINDQHGHMVGDVVLKKVARRLRRSLPGSDLMARYGGDEFVVVLHENNDPMIGQVAAERIVQVLSRPMQLDRITVGIGASVGLARFPIDATNSDELLRKADSALYRAKAQGRARVCCYDNSLDEALAERQQLEEDMRAGIRRGEFIPYYQPIVDLSTSRVQSLEVLCRWQHPQRGLVPPAQFISLAEESGQIGVMLLSVLERACAELQQFPPHWRLSVNLAPQQIQDDDLVPHLLAVLRRHQVAPRRLDVELTETALVSDTAQARSVMLALKESGITVTLDDFGTGYSSLCYLAELSFDKIKIDRSFIHTLLDKPQSAKIVDAVLGLSRSLGVQTVAEGVETEAQARMLRQLGCALAQGYLYGRPQSAADLLRGLASGADLPAAEQVRLSLAS